MAPVPELRGQAPLTHFATVSTGDSEDFGRILEQMSVLPVRSGHAERTHSASVIRP